MYILGTYELGLNETLLIRPDCNNSISNSSGGCVLINKCPQLYTQLPDQATYEKHFCEVEGWVTKQIYVFTYYIINTKCSRKL